MASNTTTAQMHTTGEHHVHGGPKVYAAVFAALLFLTVVTVAASYIHWGSGLMNVVIAMLIASVKASLVALFFMHLKYDGKMSAIIFCVCLFFLALFLIGCYTDLISREPAEPQNLRSTAIPGGQPPRGQAQGQGQGPGAPLSGTGGETNAPPIPGASPAGSHGGAAAGTNAPTPQVPH